MSYTVRSQQRAHYVVDERGATVAGPFAYHAQARRRCDQLAAGRDGTKHERALRLCMCCGQGFASEGPHNRLCKWCRQKDGVGFVGDAGGRVATSRSRA